MKRNFDSLVLDLDGNPIQRMVAADRPPTNLTLKFAAIDALYAVFPGEENKDGNEKMDLHVLARRIHGGGQVELKAEELALIKVRVGKAWPTAVVGPAWELLEEEPGATR